MDKIVKLPDPRSIEAEACAWIAQLDGGEPSAEDLKAFAEWVGRSPQHEAEIRRLSALWDELNVLTGLAAPKRKPKPVPADGLRWRQKYLSGARGVCTLATALLMALAMAFFARVWTALDQQIQLVETTKIGEQRLTTLPDGSTILLNTASQVDVDYTEDGRFVHLLSGEAHFDIAKDASRPFVVYAGVGQVRAVGTAFTVHLREQDVEVTVTEGQVELAAEAPLAEEKAPVNAAVEHKPVGPAKLGLVEAGQKAVFHREIQAIETIAKHRIDQSLSWREGILIFSGEPLEEVVDEVSRYTPITIEISDPKIRSLRIGGYFKVGEVDAMFEALESSFGIDVVMVADKLVHLRRARGG